MGQGRLKHKVFHMRGSESCNSYQHHLQEIEGKEELKVQQNNSEYVPSEEVSSY